jgi:phage anti-repressor protein
LWRGLEQFEKDNYSSLDLPQPTVQMAFEEAAPVEVVEPEVVEVEPTVDAPVVDESEPEVETPMPAIIKHNIGGEEVNAVNARDLHKKLQSKQDFSTWIKARIQKYGFVEGVDYLLHKIMVQLPSGAKYKNDYIISIRMAQELSMVEDNEIGKTARLYFIECEKIAKGETPKVEPKPESNLIENIKAASEVIDVTMTMLKRLGRVHHNGER